LALSLTSVGTAPLFLAPDLPEALDARLRAIFERREYDEAAVGPIRWLDGGKAYAWLEPVAGRQGRQLTRYVTETGECMVLATPERLTPVGASTPIGVSDFRVAPVGGAILLLANTRVGRGGRWVGDYWLLAGSDGKVRPVAAEVQQPSLDDAFSPNGRDVLFAKGHDLYVSHLATGAVTRLTSDGVVGSIGNGVNDFGGGAARWSPDSGRIAYIQNDSSDVEQVTLPAIADASDAAAQVIRFPRVGTPITRQRLGTVPVRGGRTRWVDLPRLPEGAYLEGLRWGHDGTSLLVEQMSRFKDRQSVFEIDARSARVTTVLRETDAAWVHLDHENGTRFVGNGAFAWVDSGRAFTWASERDGWRRVYAVHHDAREPRPLTPERVDVMRVLHVDADTGWILYLASPANATQSYLYRTRLDGAVNMERLTPDSQPGTHSYDVAPDGRSAIHIWSRADVPPMTEIVELPSHRPVRTLQDNATLRAKLAAWNPASTEFVRVPMDDGIEMDAWILKPRRFDTAAKYPVLVFVYGATAPTVVDAWSVGLGRGLFHKALADAGYVVISMDNPGTFAPKGGPWRRAGFGHRDRTLVDYQARGLEALARTHAYLDLSRVAVWGKSAGGTAALNLLFRRPDVYRAGIAIAPVPDMTLANAWYQETFMRTPGENPEGYRDGSPIAAADGLRGPLLLVHGTADDNALLKGTERLVSRLVALGKPFEYMTYPGRSHSLDEGEGTMMHLHRLIAQFFIEHVPPGPR
jgi:dipeptidyl-peptidase-4